MSSFYGNGGYSSGGGGGSGEVISVNGKKGQVTLDAADVHALPDSTQIPSLEGFATEAWVQEQGYVTSDVLTPLVGDADDITPQDVINALVEGRDVSITKEYTFSEVDWDLTFTTWNRVVDVTYSGNVADLAISQTIAIFNGNFYLFVTAQELMSHCYDKDTINDMMSEKSDKSTTLSGYGITDAYTKTEINEMIPENNLTNIVDGSAVGSVRGINTKLEDSSYEMGENAWAEGYDTMAKGENSHAEGGLTTASGVVSHAEGGSTVASGAGSHAEGMSTTASKTGSHAEGTTTTASGQASHAEGTTTIASGKASHAEGTSTKAQEYSSHAEGSWTTASGAASHTEGMSTTASGIASHAENMSTTAVGDYSHAEGNSTTASGPQAHAEGISTTASGMASHAEGGGTTAQGYMQHVMGEYNVPQGTQDSHTSSDYVFIVGNGTAQNPSNAFALKWDGTFVFANGTEIAPVQFTSLYNINNKIPLTGNETEGQVLTIDANGNPKWDNKIPTVTNDFTDDYKNKVDSLWEDYQDALTALG